MDTTNKPVAWMDSKGYLIDTNVLQELKDEGFTCIPLFTRPVKELTLTDELNQLLYSVNGDAYLGKDKEEALVKIVRKQYTKPVKELTDEEIKQIYKETHFSETIGDCDYMEFARAILRKAQEK